MTYIRADKSTPNEDALRTLIAGVILSILIMVGVPHAQRYWDVYLLDRPVVRASLEVVRGKDTGGIYIRYDADAIKPVTAQWIGSMHTLSDTRVATRSGRGFYNADIDLPKAWTWDAWWDQEDGTPAPAVPDFPFTVCIRYISETIDTRVVDDSGLFCSPAFDPNALR